MKINAVKVVLCNQLVVEKVGPSSNCYYYPQTNFHIRICYFIDEFYYLQKVILF